MGKKRSKTAKQKQAKASRRFGVAVKKGGKDSAKTTSILVSNDRQQQQRAKSRKKLMKQKTQETLPSRSAARRDPEHDEFDRQMASAQERLQHSTAKSNKNRKRGLKSLAPASFQVDDKEKSTVRLIEETTSSIQRGFDGIGGFVPKPLLSRAWSADKPAVLEMNNPYAVLEQNDSSDEEEAPKPQQTLPLFRFAPPSFSISSNNETDVDPDL